MSAPMSNIRNSVRSSETKRQSLTIPTAIGLVLTLASPLLYGFLVPRFLQPSVGQVTYLLLGMLFMWLLTFSVVSITLFWERQPLMSLGVRRLSWKFMLLAVGLGVVLSLAVPVLTVLMSRILPSVHAGSIGETATRSPAWVVLLGVLTAAVTEEVVFRAYPLERFASLMGKMWPGVIISLAAFVVFHVLTGWNVAHVLGVVLPLGAILTGLYIWRRNLGFVVVTHLLIDLPLFLLALGVLPQG